MNDDDHKKYLLAFHAGSHVGLSAREFVVALGIMILVLLAVVALT